MSKARRELGVKGESDASAFLSGKGYRILAQNFRTPVGEIDLVAQDGETLVFVEVKTRSSDYHGHPGDAVGPKRIGRIARAGELFLQQNRFQGSPYRIDVIAVRFSSGGANVEHFINVTG